MSTAFTAILKPARHLKVGDVLAGGGTITSLQDDHGWILIEADWSFCLQAPQAQLVRLDPRQGVEA